MPRLSLYRPHKGDDYKFFDRRMSEMFTVGGVDVNIHKYLGPLDQGFVSNTEPGGTSLTSIQDLLFLENRDRKYDQDIYTMRTIYRMNDNDFDLTQFGLFLTGDTMFAVFHLNDMIQTLGRKIIVGDVLELPNLKDLYPLDEDLPVALKRYYVVQDATRAAEGFAPTWYPHLWRVKLNPLVDSQEYKDIIDNIAAGEGTDSSIADVLSTYEKYKEVNEAIVERAEDDVPKSGYDTTNIYTAPVTPDGLPGDPGGGADTSSNANVSSNTYSSTSTVSPSRKVEGYLTSDALPPNGASVSAGIAFPSSPVTGDFFLRVDYVPNRLFRYDSRRWVKMEDGLRTNLTPGATNTTQKSGFINNTDANYENALAWDAIKVADPYTPSANAETKSFTLSSKQVVTKTPYVSTYGVQSKLNSKIITNTIANTSGNISFTVSTALTAQDVLEYTVYANVTVQRQSLSDALRPSADN
jgi:hypothetical protein